jgi:hypothetical protein
MKLSEQTLTILKNFATINPSVVFKPGSELRTISPQKTVMAIASITDEFPIQACIYDTSRFLSMCSLYENPEIDFQDSKVCYIKDGKRKTKYVFADISMVIVPPEKEINVPSEDVKVNVAWDDIQSVLKAAGVLNLPEIAFVGRDGVCYISAVDSANPTSDNHEIEIGATDDTFQLVIKTENLKLLPQDYKVTLCSKGISKFEGNGIKYFIAIESKSTYKKGN